MSPLGVFIALTVDDSPAAARSSTIRSARSRREPAPARSVGIAPHREYVARSGSSSRPNPGSTVT